MDDELIADLIAAIEAACTDGGGQLVANVKARLRAARIYVGRVAGDWD